MKLSRFPPDGCLMTWYAMLLRYRLYLFNSFPDNATLSSFFSSDNTHFCLLSCQIPWHFYLFTINLIFSVHSWHLLLSSGRVCARLFFSREHCSLRHLENANCWWYISHMSCHCNIIVCRGSWVYNHSNHFLRLPLAQEKFHPDTHAIRPTHIFIANLIITAQLSFRCSYLFITFIFIHIFFIRLHLLS